MLPHTTTYKEIYEGTITVIDPDCPTMPPFEDYDYTYYYESVGFEITRTHKLALDKPTVTISIPCSTLGIDIPSKLCENTVADFCLRELKKYIDPLNAELYNRSRPDSENGKYYMCEPGGEILKRNTAYFALCPQKDYFNGSSSTVYLLHDGVERKPLICLCIRMQVQLPYKNLRKAVQMLCRDLPKAVEEFITYFDMDKLNQAIELCNKQSSIRKWLKSSDYCAFIANGSILPRAKGTDSPMLDAIPFKSTPEDEIEICGVRGMGIKKGVTVITGGGYSGKSTLLDAISAGIYNHTLGDGRELCITDENAVTISAEDGRSVKRCNISPFIKWLPNGDTTDFSTEHASGSTSQAANIMEAIDSGTTLLLIDEDRSATNFMIRDNMMKKLIKKEPITPFTDRVNELYNIHGVSTILVIGGSGEYLSVADKIYMMDNYRIYDITKKAKNICNEDISKNNIINDTSWTQNRTFYSKHFSSYPQGCTREKLEISDMGFVIIGDEKIDVRGLHNLVSQNQINALGFMLRYLQISNTGIKINIKKDIDALYSQIEEKGLDFVYTSFFTTCERFLDLPRKQELLALINRMRKINIGKDDNLL